MIKIAVERKKQS